MRLSDDFFSFYEYDFIILWIVNIAEKEFFIFNVGKIENGRVVEKYIRKMIDCVFKSLLIKIGRIVFFFNEYYLEFCILREEVFGVYEEEG